MQADCRRRARRSPCYAKTSCRSRIPWYEHPVGEYDPNTKKLKAELQAMLDKNERQRWQLTKLSWLTAPLGACSFLLILVEQMSLASKWTAAVLLFSVTLIGGPTAWGLRKLMDSMDVRKELRFRQMAFEQLVDDPAVAMEDGVTVYEPVRVAQDGTLRLQVVEREWKLREWTVKRTLTPHRAGLRFPGELPVDDTVVSSACWLEFVQAVNALNTKRLAAIAERQSSAAAARQIAAERQADAVSLDQALPSARDVA